MDRWDQKVSHHGKKKKRMLKKRGEHQMPLWDRLVRKQTIENIKYKSPDIWFEPKEEEKAI